jgi:hypothetical protein
MEPPRRLLLIIRSLKQIISDVESWNDNNSEHPPLDTECDRLALLAAEELLAIPPSDWNSKKFKDAYEKLLAHMEDSASA